MGSDGSILGLKLADFGLAVEVFRPLHAVCGTPTYVAPEILLETGYGLKVKLSYFLYPLSFSQGILVVIALVIRPVLLKIVSRCNYTLNGLYGLCFVFNCPTIIIYEHKQF